MEVVAIIPARYASTRFPGKPLALLGGRTVIERTYMAVANAVERVVVATDDIRIADSVRAFGGEAVLTSSEHQSGTSRVNEARLLVAPDAHVVLNVQGDEPLVDTALLHRILRAFDTSPSPEIVTAVYPCADDATLEDSNVVKVVADCSSRAMYFSRSVIPFVRPDAARLPGMKDLHLIHQGIYAYRADVLGRLVHLPPSPLEVAENLEQLRWLYAGYRIDTVQAERPSLGIDTPEDIVKAEILLEKWQKQ